MEHNRYTPVDGRIICQSFGTRKIATICLKRNSLKRNFTRTLQEVVTFSVEHYCLFFPMFQKQRRYSQTRTHYLVRSCVGSEWSQQIIPRLFLWSTVNVLTRFERSVCAVYQNSLYCMAWKGKNNLKCTSIARYSALFLRSVRDCQTATTRCEIVANTTNNNVSTVILFAFHWNVICLAKSVAIPYKWIPPTTPNTPLQRRTGWRSLSCSIRRSNV